MAQYQIKSNGRKLFDLELDNKVVGKMKLVGFSQSKAEIIIGSTHLYQIEPKSFWSNTKYLKENGKLLLEFRMRWNGKIEINTYFTANPLTFVFKRKGMFKNSFLLLTDEEREVLSIVPDFKWSKFNYDYTAEVPENLVGLDGLELLIMTSLYCIIYIQNQESSAAASA